MQSEAPDLDLPLADGTVAGSVDVVRPDTDDLDLFASRQGVRLDRVERLDDGRVRVDTRRILPSITDRDGIVLNYPEAHIFLVRDGEVTSSYACAVSRSGWKMPLGTSAVETKVVDPVWHVPDSIKKEMEDPVDEMPPGPNNPLGTRWIGFGRGLGFHGNNAPSSIKHYASHGCVRLLETDVQDLYDRVSRGTPVHVCYQPVKLGVRGEKVFVGTYPDRYGLYTPSTYRRAAETLIARSDVVDTVDPEALEGALSDPKGRIHDVTLHPDPV